MIFIYCPDIRMIGFRRRCSRATLGEKTRRPRRRGLSRLECRRLSGRRAIDAREKDPANLPIIILVWRTMKISRRRNEMETERQTFIVAEFVA